MFNFKELLKIFKYNWKNIINEILPKDNKMVIEEEFINNFTSGAIINIIATLISITYFKSFNVELLRIGIMIAAIIVFNKYKNERVSSTSIFVIFIISSLGMLGSIISCVISFPLIFYRVITYFINLIYYGLSTISYAFITIACIDFCKNAREIYDKENKVFKEEKIQLKTISVDDVSMHANLNCPKCQAKISVNDLFCSHCGKKLK